MMARDCRIIPTRYDGILYRSRTEARWAVFFDALGIVHVWEPEGFDFGNGVRYLPDFYLPTCGLYAEIKGALPTQDERHKAAMLSAATHSRVVVFSGTPEARESDSDYVLVWSDGVYSGPATLAYCEPCARIVVNAGGWDDRCSCRAVASWNHHRLVTAIDTARSHRFETPARVREIRTAHDVVATHAAVEGRALGPDDLQEVLEAEGFDMGSLAVQQAILDHCKAPRSQQ